MNYRNGIIVCAILLIGACLYWFVNQQAHNSVVIQKSNDCPSGKSWSLAKKKCVKM